MEQSRKGIEVSAKAFLEYKPRSRAFVLRVYVGDSLLRTFRWKKGQANRGWPEWAESQLLERGLYVG